MHLHNTATLMLSEEELIWTPGHKTTQETEEGEFSVWIQCPEAVNSLKALRRLAAKLEEGHCNGTAMKHGKLVTIVTVAGRVRLGQHSQGRVMVGRHPYRLSHSRLGSVGL